jgi:hypothetical protein
MSDAPSPSPAADKFLRGLSQSKERSRWSTFVTIGTVVCLVAICGLCGGGLYHFRPSIAEDPAHVGVVEQQMLRIAVPAEFEPRGTIEWDFFGVVLLRGVYYELSGGDGMLMLLQVDSRLMEETDVREHVERTLREKGGGGQPLTITESEDRIFNVKGANVTFRYRRGKSPADNSQYRLVEGVVDGNTGKVLLAFRIAEDAWAKREGAVESAITSIR